MPGPKKRTEPTTQQALAAALYSEGTPVDEIAEKVGLSRRSVYNALDLAGVTRKRELHSLTPEQEAEVVRRYQAGEPVLQISRDFPEVHLTTLHNVIKRRLGGPREDLAKPRVPPEDREYAVTLCREGRKVREVAEILGTSEQTVGRILKEARDRGKVVDMPQGRPPSCLVDHDAFAVLTPEAQYWVGFLFADGCIHQDNYGNPVIMLCLAEEDQTHVEKFRDFLKSTHAIVHRPAKTKTLPSGREIHGGPIACLGVRSQKIVADLQSHGMVELKPSRYPSPALEDSTDFWRGVVDGDGSIRMSGQYPDISLGGTRTLMESFCRFMKNVDANLTARPGEDVYRVSTSGSTARRAINLLYANAIVALERKLLRARDILLNH